MKENDRQGKRTETTDRHGKRTCIINRNKQTGNM